MAKQVCLILGSVLALQAPMVLGDANVSEAASTNEVVPLFHNEHSRELIEGGTHDGVTPNEISRFVFKRTQDLLPVPFKGRAHKVARALIESANENQMDPIFLMAVISQESKFNPLARGTHGEIGLMQLKPSTAQTLVRGASLQQVSAMLADPAQNVRLGAAYMSRLRFSFRHRSSLYIAAYNMGAAGVRSKVASGETPHVYSASVLGHYVELSGAMTEAALAVASARPQLQVLNRTLVL